MKLINVSSWFRSRDRCGITMRLLEFASPGYRCGAVRCDIRRRKGDAVGIDAADSNDPNAYVKMLRRCGRVF